MKRYVIIGCGIAGATAAEELRRRDPDARITIFHGESFPFYYRAAMAFYVKGLIGEEELNAKPPGWMKHNRLRVVTDKIATIRIAEREVVTASGYAEPYDALLIATGSGAFMAPWPGADLEGVMTYHSMVCVNKKLSFVKKHKVKKTVIVGGGILGVEMADNFNHMGLDVTMLIRGKRPLDLLLDDGAASIIQTDMERDGITILSGTEMSEIVGDEGRVKEIRLTSGDTIPAEFVGVAIGVTPADNFLEGSGVETDRGVLVDEKLQTNIEGIFAAGDVAVRREGTKKIPCRTWLTASRMGEQAAANMCGSATPYTETMFNASHAYKSLYAIVGEFNAPAQGGVSHHILYADHNSYGKVIVDGEKVIGGQFVGDLKPAWQVYHAIEQASIITPDQLVASPGGSVTGLPPLPYRFF